jgi:hypothetical protein
MTTHTKNDLIKNGLASATVIGNTTLAVMLALTTMILFS